MDKRIFVPPPDKSARESLFNLFLEGRPLADDIDFSELAEKTELYAAADIELIVNESARKALLSDAENIRQSHILESINRFPTSLNEDLLSGYMSFMNLQRA